MKLAPALYAVTALALSLAAPAPAQEGGAAPATNGGPQNRPLPTGPSLLSPHGGAGVLHTRRSAYRPGQPVAIAFTVANTTKSAVNYDFPTGQQFDVTAADPKGAPVWDWARGRTFAPTVTHIRLKPGERKTYAATWDGRDFRGRPVRPGTYTLSARMTSSDRPGLTGGFLVDPDTDPENTGFPTRSPADNGAVRQVEVNPPITASATVAIGAAPPPR